MGRDGQRRRSPRISALDACKENHQNTFGEEQRQLSRTRTRIKRKFDDSAFTSVSKLAKQVWKGRVSPQNADHSTDCVEWRSGHESQIIKENQEHDDHAITNGKASIMPAKHILELVLDTLQRRDTYEIFAEPVDPDEVEDYYEIIKEPMDFGTMRAKLHEGMYENLEQFEHDVFLIPENAMHFNSSATIYFRQARAIQELAKKVFHALKTDPENFVSEFSGTRRRSMRKALSDTKDSRFSMAKSGSVGSDVSSKGTLHSPSTSTFRRTSKKNHGCTGMGGHFYARNFLTGSRGGTLSSSEVADKRFTYWAWRSSSYNEKNSVDSTFYSSYKPLVLMNQGDISYKDSLMSYVKGLGPIAQMVAKRKLLGKQESNIGWIGSEKCQISAAKQRKCGSLDENAFRTFRDFAPGCNPFLKASDIVDLTEDGEEANGRNRRVSYGIPGKERSSDCGGAPGKEKIDIPSSPAVTLTTRRGSINVDMVAKKGGVSTRNPVARDLNCSASNSSRSTNNSNRSNNNTNTSFRDDNVRPVILALENSHSNVAEFKSKRNKKSCNIVPSPSPALGSFGESSAAAVSSLGHQQNQPLPLISQFTFDLPFLKARLNQMNALERGSGEFLKRPSYSYSSFEKGGGGGGGGGGVERALNCTRQAESVAINKPFLYNHQSSPSLDSNLALQL
ncbi:hypothetical protein Pfo_030036 [Paulownia fortunei]|nr:hypothetical protein Pfo_030036 [Paulownia fortunei]